MLIAKLDRLGRNVAFVSALLESNVDIKAVDMPHVDKVILHIMAAIAQYEREQISKKTKAALQAAKRRGVELGFHGKHVLSKVNKIKAQQFALTMQPLLVQLQNNGVKTVKAITSELNKAQVPTYYSNGKRWHISTVHNVLQLISNETANDNKAPINLNTAL